MQRCFQVFSLIFACVPWTLAAQLSLPEALETAFPPPATVERKTAFLSDEDVRAVNAAAGRDATLKQRVISYYVGRRDGRPIGVAYFDSHRVRTLNEVVMIVIQPPARLSAIEVLRFAEPPEYQAREAWLKQFQGKSLSQELSLEGSIANMTGATLTSHAIVRASRRVLALHQQIRPFASSGAARR